MPDPHFGNTPAYFKEIASGDTPSSGQVALYAKADGKMYYKDDLGVETAVGGGGSAPAAIEAVKTDAFTTTSTNGTWADVTGLSVNITPSSTAKKVRVEVFLTVSTSSQAAVAWRILRDATPLPLGDVTESRTGATGVITTINVFYAASSFVALIDAPASASAQTYKVQVTGLFGAALTTHINRTHQNDNAGYTVNGISLIRVQEVD